MLIVISANCRLQNNNTNDFGMNAEELNIIPAVEHTSAIDLPPEQISFCNLCDTRFINAEYNYLICVRCNNRFHQIDDCKFGICIVQDQKQGVFCSMRCCRNVEVYEVEIIGETTKYYRVRWNNDDVTLKPKSKMNKLAEYYKLVTLWQQRENVTSTLQNDDGAANCTCVTCGRIIEKESGSPIQVADVFYCTKECYEERKQ